MTLNVLIADDNNEKIKYIVDTLNSVLDNYTLDISNSYNSTTKLLRKNNYELLILDMTMPNFDPVDNNSSPTLKPLAGKDVLAKLHYRKVNIPVIVLTQFDIFGRLSDVVGLEDLKQDLKNSFPRNFLGCVFYDPQSSAWSTDLINLIKGIQRNE